MKKFLTFVIMSLFAVNAFAANCDIELKNVNLCAQIEFANTPKTTGDNPFVLSFWQKNTQGHDVLFVPNYTLEVQLWMPGMGHGSKPVKIAAFPKTGVFYINNVYFMMPGLWEVRVKLVQVNPDGTKTQADYGSLELDL